MSNIEHCTRVFQLFPGGSHDVLRGKLTEIDLDNADNTYEALSYTWGSQTTPRQIECDGFKITITCNLHSALRRLRKAAETVRLFIDALSIDQGEDTYALRERSIQIANMSTIFARARCVYVYYGEEEYGCDEAIRLLKQFGQMPDEDWVCSEHTKARIETNGELYRRYASTIPSLQAPVWDFLIALTTRPWVKRTWIIQEYAVAKDVRFIVGNQVLTQRDFFLGRERAFKWAHMAQPGSPSIGWAGRNEDREAYLSSKGGEHGWRFSLLGDLRDGCSERSEGMRRDLKLHNLLRFTREFRTTDPRDKVYALISLVRDEDMSSIKEHYGESVNSLSGRVSELLVEQGHVLDLLYHLAGWHTSKVSSWMVDLTLTRQIHPIDFCILRDGSCNEFNACFNTPLWHRLKKMGSLLELHGCLVDTLAETSSVYPDPPQITAYDNLWRYHRDWDINTFLWGFNHMGGDPQRRSEILKCYKYAQFAGGRIKTCPWKLTNEHMDAWSRLVDIIIQSRSSKLSKHSWFGRRTRKDVEIPHEVEWKVSEMTRYMILLKDRRIGITTNGRFCSVPFDAEPGDVIGIIYGAAIPLVLRRRGDYFRIIGGTYVHGIMDGEALRSGAYQSQSIIIC